ncbi:MAG: lycopene cyclase domain-containing protein [Sphingobacteriaceae bacterium]|nr:lycopene cyclase domain-containing protein [Sphingobacteriaceae bacterium]
MNNKFTYLIIDVATILAPFIFSFHTKLNFHKTWKAFWPANILVTILFIAWDMLYTKIGVWGFNENYICGLKILNLPIEEVLFFICVPYASLFTYHCFKLFFKKIKINSLYVSIFLIISLSITGIVFVTKLYTVVTLLSLCSLIIYLFFIEKAKWLSLFYFSYLIILLPFFIVNGILTGSWIDEPIVWYNNTENMNVRLFTIPFEDVFYGMLLLLLNTWLYERNLQKGS